MIGRLVQVASNCRDDYRLRVLSTAENVPKVRMICCLLFDDSAATATMMSVGSMSVIRPFLPRNLGNARWGMYRHRDQHLILSRPGVC